MTSADRASTLKYEQDYYNETHVPQLIAVLTSSLIIAYTAVALRLISRRMSQTQLKWDDWIIIFSLLFTSGFIILVFVNIGFGLGRHDIMVKNPVALRKNTRAAELFYIGGLVSFKFSALCLLQRLFPGRSFKHALLGIGGFVLAYSVVSTFVIIFECKPFRRIWYPSVRGHCIDIVSFYIVCGSFNIVTDFIILGLPMPKLWTLHLPTKHKIQLMLLFALGGTVCIISIIRTTQLKKLASGDLSYSQYAPIAFSALELAFGNLSVCLPTYRPLMHYVFGRMTSYGTATTKPRSGPKSSTIANISQQNLAINENRSHPFTRLQEDLDRADSWSMTIPLSTINQTAEAEQSSPGNTIDFGFETNEIRVTTDLEQNST